MHETSEGPRRAGTDGPFALNARQDEACTAAVERAQLLETTASGGEAPLREESIELPGATLHFELRDYTRSLADRVEEALESQGIPAEPGASKVIEVEVVYADILTHGRSHCVVDVTLRTADGYVRGHQARAKSGFVDKACNAALSKAALARLSDRNLRAYLSGS